MSSLKLIKSVNLVKSIILEPIYLNDRNAESLKFRIEFFQWSPNCFTCKLWREETYLVKPRFQPGDLEWDTEIYVLESGLPWDEIKEKSLESAVDKVIQLIQNTFSVAIDH
ncbi:MAG: hypothetical protein AAF685_13780 [Cyanobacteria bacterium P01_C01_bin.89]